MVVGRLTAKEKRDERNSFHFFYCSVLITSCIKVMDKLFQSPLNNSNSWKILSSISQKCFRIMSLSLKSFFFVSQRCFRSDFLIGWPLMCFKNWNLTTVDRGTDRNAFLALSLNAPFSSSIENFSELILLGEPPC